ncbi:hypothetical protein BH11CYA1_BH11CYA1_00020 [soil metagenome]
MRYLLILALIFSTVTFADAAFAKSPKSSSYRLSVEPQAPHNAAESSEAKTAPSSTAANSDYNNSSVGSQSASSETVKVDNLPNLRALLNIIANGIEILCIAIGAPACLLVPVGLVFLWMKGKRWWGAAMVLFGPIVVIIGLATPGVVIILFQAICESAKFD